jgi:hypothetical protein
MGCAMPRKDQIGKSFSSFILHFFRAGRALPAQLESAVGVKLLPEGAGLLWGLGPSVNLAGSMSLRLNALFLSLRFRCA